jgi:hypothetical protein
MPEASMNARSLETKIARLTREIAEIEEFFYTTHENRDRVLYADRLEHKRDDIVRSAVLQVHTAIDDILNAHIACRLLNSTLENYRHKMHRTQSGRALHDMLRSIGFEAKLNLAVTLRLLNAKSKERLKQLNSLRNKCSHNWLLKSPVRRGKMPGQKKPPLLMYQNRDLHNVAVLKEFLGEYGPLYAKLYEKFTS